MMWLCCFMALTEGTYLRPISVSPCSDHSACVMCCWAEGHLLVMPLLAWLLATPPCIIFASFISCRSAIAGCCYDFDLESNHILTHTKRIALQLSVQMVGNPMAMQAILWWAGKGRKLWIDRCRHMQVGLEMLVSHPGNDPTDWGGHPDILRWPALPEHHAAEHSLC